MGTSSFAVPTLQRLFEHGYPIASVITQPDKPSGRGQSFQASPIKRKAQELHLNVHQPAKLRDDEARSLFETLRPELIVVVAYGKIIPPWLIALPRHGVLNVHGSLLPKYRGAAPIQWAMANGESETGVCTMQIDEGVDTGPVYLCEKTPIDPEESVAALAERLAQIGADLAQRTIVGIQAGTLHATPQDHSRATMAPILGKQDGIIDWQQPAQVIHNRIRAFTPWPGMVARFRQTVCKFLKSKPEGTETSTQSPGAIIATKKSLAVVCGDGRLLEVLELQLPNRKPSSGRDFLNGLRVQPGEKFEPVMDNEG
jgi:methionyl-tRNA formyltransferase